MKKWMILIAWFFVYQHDLFSNVMLRGLVGPFEDKAACEKFRTYVVEELEIKQVSACKEKSET
jgi:hypothetical protein